MKFLLKNTRYIVIFIVSCIILYTRSVEAVICSIGAIVCGLTAKILKYLLKQPRPNQSIVDDRQSLIQLFSSSNDYGMPSSHTASLSYFAMYASFKLHWVFVFIIWIAVLFTMWTRVFYQYHTTAQVLAGFGLGVLISSLFLTLYDSYR